MDDDEINALAKGVAPYVRECVAETIGKMMLVPPDLAEQVAGAVRLLHETPPVVEPSETRSSPKVMRIERDEQGNFIPVYDELQA
jgi:hypothetical protein